MKIEVPILKDVDPASVKPILVAKLFYVMFSNQISFEDDLDDYLLNHVVVARPTCFGMARIHNLAKEGEPYELAWFIRIAVGDLRELLNALPAHLPKICWCRNKPGKPFDKKLRVYKLDRLRDLAYRKETQ